MPGFPLTLCTSVDDRQPAFGELLSDGTPDLRLAPRVALARAYRGRDVAVLGYGDTRGHVRLRRALGGMLSATRGLRVSEDDVLITRGSQMALELVSGVLCGPRDVVRSRRSATAPPGTRWRRSLRAVHVTPQHQYPTTATLSAGRRLALLALARRRRFAIIEDDYDHEFHYQGRPALPLASADGAGVVEQCSEPCVRLGFAARTPDETAREIERLARCLPCARRRSGRARDSASAPNEL